MDSFDYDKDEEDYDASDMLSPKANSQQVETVRGAETVRETESPSARIGLQRKALNHELSNSISNSSDSYGEDFSDEISVAN